MKKGFLATILVLCMVLGMLPGTAWAEDTDLTIENRVFSEYTGSSSDVVIPNGGTSSGEYTSPEKQHEYIGGPCGENVNNVTWQLVQESIYPTKYVLYIRGSGNMYDFDYWGRVPWYSYREFISRIVIEPGVTSIGSFAFYGCIAIEGSMVLPDSITSIGFNAFYNCANLTGVTIPDSVTSIGASAFSHCTDLADVYYNGDKSQWDAIKIGDYNDCLTSATIHYNSGSKVYVYICDGKYTDSSGNGVTPTISNNGDTAYIPAGADGLSLDFIIYEIPSDFMFSDNNITYDKRPNSNLIVIDGDCGLTATGAEIWDAVVLHLDFDGTAKPGTLDITFAGFALEDAPDQLATDKDGHLVTSNTLHVVVQGDDTPPTLQKQPTPTNVSFSKGVLSWTPTFVGSKNPDNDGAMRWCKLDFKNVDTHEERTVTLSCLHGMINKYAITNTDWPSGTYTVQITSLARPYLDTTMDGDPTLPYRFVYTKPNGYLPCVEDCAWKIDSFPAMTWNYDAKRLADVKEFRIFPRVAESEDGVYKDFVHLYLDNWEGSLSVAPSADGIYTSQDLETAVKAHGEGWYVFEVMAISNNELWMDGDIKSCRADYHYVPSTNIIQGDLNGDSKVTMADVIRLARGAAGYVTLTEQEQTAGDVTGDGKITMADVIRVARYAAGYSTSL